MCTEETPEMHTHTPQAPISKHSWLLMTLTQNGMKINSTGNSTDVWSSLYSGRYKVALNQEDYGKNTATELS